VEAPIIISSWAIFDYLHLVLLEKGKKFLEGRNPLMTQSDPRPALAPELHGLVREIEKQNPTRSEFPDPKLKGVLPVHQMFQTVRAEHEVQGRVWERVQFVRILEHLIPYRYGARQRPVPGPYVDAATLTEAERARRDVGARVPAIEAFGVEIAEVSIVRALTGFDSSHKKPIDPPPYITKRFSRIPNRRPEFAGKHQSSKPSISNAPLRVTG
jgi:hypothetical protein